MDFFNDVLYVGDATGNIYRYLINTKDQSVDIINPNIKDTPFYMGSKKPIEVLRILTLTGNLLILLDGQLISVDGKTLNKIEVVIPKNCLMFCINENE